MYPQEVGIYFGKGLAQSSQQLDSSGPLAGNNPDVHEENGGQTVVCVQTPESQTSTEGTSCASRGDVGGGDRH